jgi:NAD(P)-dependent dehydrogenase (short-subunit alcohol dehydrogenase family)
MYPGALENRDPIENLLPHDGSPPASATRAVAIVTDGTSDTGTVAIALADVAPRRGRRHRRTLRANTRLLAQSSPGTEHLALALDVSDEADMRTMAERTVERFARIDLLVASAGLGRRSDSDRVMPHATAQLPLEEWKHVLDVNLRGVFLSNRAVLQTMTAQGRGQIINVCSSV